MGKNSEKYEMLCTEVKKETGAALLCVTREHGEVWVPKSQIDEDSEVYKEGTDGRLIVTQWIAEQKGWV
jgi:hypothetical protein